MQRFTAQWIELKILNVSALPYQGENEEDHPCMSLHRKEILQLIQLTVNVCAEVSKILSA